MSLMGIVQNKAEKYLADFFDGKWTLVDAKSGQNICTFTSFIDSEIKDEQKVTNEAVEEGSFASYNKVETPLEVKVTLGLSGTTAVLQNALDALKKYCHSTDLVNLVTPTAEYESLNLERFDYQLKRENGRGALYVALQLVEIRQVKTVYTNAKVAPQQDRGKVQTKSDSKASSGNSGGTQSQAEKCKRTSLIRSATGSKVSFR